MNFTNFMLLSTMALVAATSASAEGSDALPQLRGADAVQKSCIDDKKPKKDGYEFEYVDKGKCVDKHDKTYEYGQFDDVKDFSKCAKKCVGGDLSDRLVDELKGFDWNCDNQKCHCLFNEGTLKSKDEDTFDRVVRDKDGKGKVEDTKDADDWYCAKLKKNSSSRKKSSSSSSYTSADSHCNQISDKKKRQQCKSNKPLVDFDEEFVRTEFD